MAVLPPPPPVVMRRGRLSCLLGRAADNRPVLRKLRGTAMAAAALAACKQAPPPPPPPPTVRVVKAEARSVEQTFEWPATLDGSINAEIRPRVSGVVEKVAYPEGTVVRV